MFLCVARSSDVSEVTELKGGCHPKSTKTQNRTEFGWIMKPPFGTTMFYRSTWSEITGFAKIVMFTGLHVFEPLCTRQSMLPQSTSSALHFANLGLCCIISGCVCVKYGQNLSFFSGESTNQTVLSSQGESTEIDVSLQAYKFTFKICRATSQ